MSGRVVSWKLNSVQIRTRRKSFIVFMPTMNCNFVKFLLSTQCARQFWDEISKIKSWFLEFINPASAIYARCPCLCDKWQSRCCQELLHGADVPRDSPAVRQGKRIIAPCKRWKSVKIIFNCSGTKWSLAAEFLVVSFLSHSADVKQQKCSRWNILEKFYLPQLCRLDGVFFHSGCARDLKNLKMFKR